MQRAGPRGEPGISSGCAHLNTFLDQALGSAHSLLLLWPSEAVLASLQPSHEALRCILGCPCKQRAASPGEWQEAEPEPSPGVQTDPVNLAQAGSSKAKLRFLKLMILQFLREKRFRNGCQAQPAFSIPLLEQCLHLLSSTLYRHSHAV